MATSGRHRAAPSPPRAAGNPSGYRMAERRPELIAAASGAALLLLVGIFAGWAHHSLTSPRVVSTLTATAPAAPNAVPSNSSSLREPLRAWLDQAEPSIVAVLTARHLIASAAANNDITRLGATCESAESAVAALQHVLPSPDARLTNTFQQAINGYVVGLRYCLAGAQTRDGKDLAQAATHLGEANGELQAAVDLVMTEIPGAGPSDPHFLTV